MHKDTNFSELTKIPVTLLHGTNPKPLGYSTLDEVFSKMINPKKRDQILELRRRAIKAKETGDETDYKAYKNTLIGFILGEWTHRADDRENCKTYVPILVLDIDYSYHYDGDFPPFSDALRDSMFAALKNNPYTLAVFYSPSGGLRCIVKAKSTYQTHRVAYERLMNYFSHVTGLPILKSRKVGDRKICNAPFGIDPTCINESRFFYMVDGLIQDKIYVNPDSLTFDPETDVKPDAKDAPLLPLNDTSGQISTPQMSDADAWELIEKFTDERISSTRDSGRNGRVLFMAQLAHEHGFSEYDITAYCEQYVEPGFNLEEIRATVKSAIKRTNGQKFSREQLAHYVSKRTNSVAPKVDKIDSEKKSDDLSNTYKQIVRYLEKNWEFRLDIVSNEMECRKKGGKEWGILNENNLLHELRSKGYKISDTVLSSILGSDFVPKFDPFIEYFKNLHPYHSDEGSHIDHLATFVMLKDEAKDRDWFNRMFKKALVRMAAAATLKIPFNKQAVVLKSDQNDGKSTFLRWLVPFLLYHYRADWTRDEVSDKDGRFALPQNFLINLDELSSFGKANIEQIKAIMSLDHIKDRLPYGKRPVRMPRRASFVGSTNRDEFLTDESGSVRWLVFEIAGIQHDSGGLNGYGAKIDINRVWAEAWYLLNTGQVQPQMTKEDIAESEQRNRSFQVVTTENEMIAQYLIPVEKDQAGSEFLTATEITNFLQGLTHIRLNRNQIGPALRFLGFKLTREFLREGRVQVRGFWVKKEVENAIKDQMK